MAKLQFAATLIRFDISFAVSHSARLCASVGSAQGQVSTISWNILQYTPASKSSIAGFRNWWTCCPNMLMQIRATSGTVMLYSQLPIMWKSKMQKNTALSTAEAEYYSALAAGCEVLHLRAPPVRPSLSESRIQTEKPTQDNTACITWGKTSSADYAFTQTRQAHGHQEALRPRSHPERCDAAGQGSDSATVGRHRVQGTTSCLPQVLACVDGILGRKSNPST